MHGQERRGLATGTFIKFDHSYADTIAELGYPTRSALRAWWNEHERTGEVPTSRLATNPRHAAETGRRAAGHYPGHGKSLARTTGALGYPKSRERPSERADELAPGRRRHRGPGPGREATPPEGKVRVVAELEARGGSAAGMAERHGVSRTAPYLWRREMTGDSGGEPEGKGEPAGRGSDDLPDGAGVSRDVPREAKTQPGRVQPGPGARQATLEIARKDPGADPELPADAERAAMATAPGDKHGPCCRSGTRAAGRRRAPRASSSRSRGRAARSSGRRGPGAARRRRACAGPWPSTPGEGRVARLAGMPPDMAGERLPGPGLRGVA